MPPTMVAPGYARAYQAQAVLTASPGQLILMLYDGGLRFLGHALDALRSTDESTRRIETINTNLLKAQAIIAELRTSLNHEAGGDYSANLDRLYDYFLRRLLQGNVRKQVEPVAEVEKLLRELRDGWAEMLRTQEAGGMHSKRGVA